MFPSLTYTQRLTGCLSCAAFGFLLSFGSFFRFTALLKGNPTPFAVCFTLGSIVALTGTCFLTGPRGQIKKMCKKTRIGATIMYLGSIVGTLGVAFGLEVRSFEEGAMNSYIIYIYTYKCRRPLVDPCPSEPFSPFPSLLHSSFLFQGFSGSVHVAACLCLPPIHSHHMVHA